MIVPAVRQNSAEASSAAALPAAGPVTQASYWDRPQVVPQIMPQRRVAPVPATYPTDHPAPQQQLPHSQQGQLSGQLSGQDSTSHALRTTPKPFGPASYGQPAVTRPPLSAPSAGPATLEIPSAAVPTGSTVRPGHALAPQPAVGRRLPAGGLSVPGKVPETTDRITSEGPDTPVHVYPNRMTSSSLDVAAPGEPPVHVFPTHGSGETSGLADSADGRPTSILPKHLQTPPPPRGQLTAQTRLLEPVPQNNLPPIPIPTPDPISRPSGPTGLHQPSPLPPIVNGRPVTGGNSVIGQPPAAGRSTGPQVFLPPATNGGAGVPAAALPLGPTPAPPSGDRYHLLVNPPAQTVVVPGESSDLLSWWESDVSRSVFSGRQPMELTLEQALGLALAEAPELQILHSDWFIRQVEIARQDAVFDWTSFVEGVWNRDSVPVSSSLDGATNRLRSRTSSGQAGLRRLLRDGGELEISQVIGTENSNSQFISPNNQGTSRLQMEWTHRLLRGGGEAYNSSRIRIAAIENDSSFDLFQEGVQDHLLNVASSYWILVLRRGRFVQSVTSWNRAGDVAREMAERVDLDVSPAMLDRARSEVATRLAAAIEAQHDVYRAQDALLRLIYGPEFVQYASREVVTRTLPMKQAPAVAAETQIERAIRNRSEVHRSIRNIKIAAVQYEVAEEEVLPVLDMTLTGYAAGLRGNNDVGGSIINQFTEGEPGVGIGFNFEVPYRNRAALAAAEQARVAIKRMQAELETTIADVSEDVRDQVTQRNKYGAVLRQQWESLARSRRLLKTIQTRRRYLADGTRVADLYLENLLQTQERLELAESRYLQSQIRFAVADNALLRAVSMIDTLAAPTGAEAGPAAAVRESAGRKSSSYIDHSQNPALGGYAPMNLDAVYEPPQPPIAR